MKERQRQLTKAETQVMNIVWDLPEGKGTVQDILDRYPEPKPAYTTLLTFTKRKSNIFSQNKKFQKIDLRKFLVDFFILHM